jgi:ABC-type antimicrobial peptide transport system permease subunit
MSSRQVLGSVAVELVILLGVGGLLGALMGSWLSALLLPFLDITGAGEVALPPLVVMRTWGGVFLVYGGMGAVFGVLLWFVLRWFSRLALQQALRLEEG